MNSDKVALKAVKIALASVMVVLVVGGFSGWVLLTQTAAVAQMSHAQKDLIRRVESLEAQLDALMGQKGNAPQP